MTAGRADARDRGAAAVWVLGCAALVLAIGVLVLVRGLAVLARHRAETAADFAALAAANRIGLGGDPCAAAREIAAANDAALRSCTVSLGAGGRTGTVRVEVVAQADLPVVGERSVTARARAGRLPGGPPADLTASSLPEPVCAGKSVAC